MHIRIYSALSSLAVLCLVASSQPATAKIIAQPPCDYGANAFCMNFLSEATPSPFVIRSFKFKMNKPGKALVRFDGSMACRNPGPVPFAYSFDSQIVTSQAATVSHQGPGGARFAMVFIDGGKEAINLGSSRVISYSSAGMKQVFLKFGVQFTGSGISCDVFSAAFVVTTQP